MFSRRGRRADTPLARPVAADKRKIGTLASGKKSSKVDASGVSELAQIVVTVAKTGQIRGLLCRGCNLALGNMKEDPIRLQKAADYLYNYKKLRRVG